MFKTSSFPTSGGYIYFINGRWPIVYGHTDMSCGIDALSSVVSDKYNLDLFNDAIFLFCRIGGKKIATRLYIGIVMDSCYCTNGSRMAPTRFISTLSEVWKFTMVQRSRWNQEINLTAASVVVRGVIYSLPLRDGMLSPCQKKVFWATRKAWSGEKSSRLLRSNL